ncbi:MAG TPA: hypothetical protein VGB46_12590 [Flavisolibacter sp.]|jgi:ABC-type oligopeptide transport system substrate-binding subunit
MKKILLCVFLSLALAACNNDTSNKEAVEPAPNTTNVQNVNGNMPDTTTGISLDNNQSVPDSVRK